MKSPLFFFSPVSVFDQLYSDKGGQIVEPAHLAALEEVWHQLGAPTIEHWLEIVDLPFRRREIDVFFSAEIPRTVFHPFIVKYDSQAIENRGLSPWLKNNFLTLLTGCAHLLRRDYQGPELQAQLDLLPFTTPMERNYVLYFALLSPIYENLFDQSLVTKLKSGPMHPIWAYVEQQGWEKIVNCHFGCRVKSVLPELELRDRIQEFFQIANVGTD